MIIPKSYEELAEFLEKEGKFVFFFTADWCPDCQFIYPALPDIEAENPDELFDAIKIAHEAVFKEGVGRVVTSMKMDDRRDRERNMGDKVRSVEKRLG